jgi:hypothetical protein
MATGRRKNTSTSEKMSRSIESQVESGLRSFLAKSGAPAIAAGPTGNTVSTSLDSLLNLGSGGTGIISGLGSGLGAAKGTQIRTLSADASSLLPPINRDNKDPLVTMQTGFLDSLDSNRNNNNSDDGSVLFKVSSAGAGAGISTGVSGSSALLDYNDDDEDQQQCNNRQILESLLSTELQQQMKHLSYHHPSNPGGRKVSQKLVSGSQFRIPMKEPVACIQCEQFDRNIRKLKEANRMLRLQVARLEEKLHDLRRVKGDKDGSGSDTGDFDNDNIANNADPHNSMVNKKVVDGLENEIQHWKKKYIELDQNKVMIDCQLLSSKKEVADKNELIAQLKQLIAELKSDKETMDREGRLSREKLALELDQNNR